jgi:hypothetical protein
MDAAYGNLEEAQADGPEGRGTEERCIEVLENILQVRVFVEKNALESSVRSRAVLDGFNRYAKVPNVYDHVLPR